MFLNAEQLSRIAAVYDKVAADELSVPSPQRAAFARKAKHLRMLARIATKIEATNFVKTAQPVKSQQEPIRPAQPLKSQQESVSVQWCRPKLGSLKVMTLAERLEAARIAASAGVRKKKHEPFEERPSHPFCFW
jgi:hypothetical protein